MAANVDLPPEQQASYTVIIDGILATADLDTITTKRIREGLQKAVHYDLTPQKGAIKELIMQRFDKFHAEKEVKAEPLPPAPVTTVVAAPEPAANGHQESSSASPIPAKRKADSEEVESSGELSAVSPPKKKVRKVEEDADAVLAAKLQAEENARSRPTRGGNARKAAPTPKKKAATKKKSKSKVNVDDDSDLEGEPVERKVNRNSGFHKELILSPALSELLGGVVKISRPQATKKLWQYIKEHELQDPGDKRQIRCDDAMRAVFKVDSIGMFKMTKAMNQNMYNEGE